MAPAAMRRDFPYDTRPFRRSLRLHAVAVIALGLVGILALNASSRLLLPSIIFLLAAVVVFAMMVLGPLSPLGTKHSVTGKAVVLRQGWFFTLMIPFSNLARVRAMDDIPGGGGVRLRKADATLQILSSGRGVVGMELREPMMFRRAAVELVLTDVEDREGFVSCLREATAAGQSPGKAQAAKRGGGAPHVIKSRVVKKAGAGASSEGAILEPPEPEAGEERERRLELRAVEELVVPLGKESESGPGEQGEELQEISVEPVWTGEGEGGGRGPRVMKIRMPKR
ncbi:MAG: hypothetical protein ACUVV6_08860 [Thermoplasmatota archaeon]